MVIWLIGMSGAGKTTIGRKVFQRLRARHPNVVFLDGDGIREVMGDDLGHTLADRRINAGRISRLCKLLDDQGIDVVCAVLSIFPDWQAWNREHIEHYFEVYVRVPFEELVRRDPKGLYRKALTGQIQNVVGVDIEFLEPPQADLVVDNGGSVGLVDDCAEQIVAQVSRA